MQVQINLVDQNNPFRLVCHLIQKLWIQQCHTIRNVRNHAQHIPISITHFIEWMHFRFTVAGLIDKFNLVRLDIIATLCCAAFEFGVS